MRDERPALHPLMKIGMVDTTLRLILIDSITFCLIILLLHPNKHTKTTIGSGATIKTFHLNNSELINIAQGLKIETMKLSTALSIVVATHSSANNLATAQECVLGAFTLEFEGTCDFSTILEEYTRQVFDATGNVDAAACGSMSAEDDLKAKLELAGTSAEELCSSALNDRDVT